MEPNQKSGVVIVTVDDTTVRAFTILRKLYPETLKLGTGDLER